MASAERIEQFVAELRSRNIDYVRFEIADLHGISRTKVIPIDKVARYAERGLNFYGGVLALDSASHVVPGSGMNEEVSYRDQQLIPDLDTVQIIPWLENTAKVICDVRWAPGDPIKAAPRHMLASLLTQAEDMGFDVMMGHEFEFYLLDPETKAPLFGGVHIFNSVRNQYVPFLDEVLNDLQDIGIDVITHNCEYSPSQFEINFGPGVGLAGADKAFTFKNAVKELAHRAGFLATFMSKPATDMAGCGCHVHMSLLKKGSEESAFAGNESLVRQFACGILDHAKAIAPLIGPTPNCYHRLKPHTFAPSNISWGDEDRTAMVRLKDMDDDNAHIEMRAASGMSNPYVTASAVLAAGLLGIRAGRDLETQPDGPSEEIDSLPKLPQSLEDALAGLEADGEMQEMLGADFIKVFTTVKQYELARFRGHVTDWERDEYMEVY